MVKKKAWLRPLQDFVLHFLFATGIIFFINQRIFIPNLKQSILRYGIDSELEPFIQEFLGEGQSLPMRYWHYLIDLLTLDFGLLDKAMLVDAIGSTTRLLVASGFLALLIGISFGIVWGWTSRKSVSNVNYSLSVGLRSFPPFVILWVLGPFIFFELFHFDIRTWCESNNLTTLVIASAIYPAGLIMLFVRNAVNDLAFELYIEKSLTPETGRGTAKMIGHKIATTLLVRWRYLFTILITAVLVSESFYPGLSLPNNLGYLLLMSMWEDFILFQSLFIILTTIWLFFRLIEQYALLIIKSRALHQANPRQHQGNA